MKKLVLLVFVAVVTVGSMMAQAPQEGGRRNGGDRSKEQLERMKTDLNLTPDQVAKIEVVLKEEQKTMMELRANGSGDRDKMREEMMKMRTARETKMKEILTPEQLQKQAEIAKNAPQRMQQNRGAKPDSASVNDSDKKSKRVKKQAPVAQ